MAFSLNSLVGFTSQLHARYHNGPRDYTQKVAELTSYSAMFNSRICIKGRRRKFQLVFADPNRLATDSSENRSVISTPAESFPGDAQIDEPATQTTRGSNGSTVVRDSKQEEKTNSPSKSRTSPLTARERLKAARVLSRYTESKSKKSEMGSKVMDALRESDKGKRRPGLPEAPLNMFDDSKRGLPKPGLTFQFPGGTDLFFIILSFVLISSVMLTTTYIVWKAGAIHFNEY